MTRKQKLRAICWIAGLCLFCALYPGTAAAQVQPQTKEITAPTLEQDVQTEMTLETPAAHLPSIQGPSGIAIEVPIAEIGRVAEWPLAGPDDVAWSVALEWAALEAHETTSPTPDASAYLLLVFASVEGSIHGEIDVDALSQRCRTEIFVLTFFRRMPLSEILAGKLSRECRSEVDQKVRLGLEIRRRDVSSPGKPPPLLAELSAEREVAGSLALTAGYGGYEPLRPFPKVAVDGPVRLELPFVMVVPAVFEVSNQTPGFQPNAAAVASRLEQRAGRWDPLLRSALEEIEPDVAKIVSRRAEVATAMAGRLAERLGAAIADEVGSVLPHAGRAVAVGHSWAAFTAEGYQLDGELFERELVRGGPAGRLWIRRPFDGGGADYALGFDLAFRESVLRCVRFRPDELELRTGCLGECHWLVFKDDPSTTLRWWGQPGKASVEAFVDAFAEHGITQHCQIGDPSPVLDYWLAGGVALTTVLGDSTCKAFEPGELRVTGRYGRFRLRHGQTDIVRPSLQEHEAEHLLRLVRQYGATKYCGLWFAGTAYWAR